ncbi:MAG: hypothetical protein ACP5NK_06495 [Thermoplasmata archaeon]
MKLSKIVKSIEGMINMDMIEIKKGASYVVVSNSGKEDPMRTEGEYVGYTILGEEGAIVFRVKGVDNKSFLRLIPVSNLYAIEFSEENLMHSKENEKTADKAYYIS